MTNEDLAGLVAAALDGRTVATAESCTAGRVAASLASAENATAFFRGGLVAYQEQTKRKHLGVTADSMYSVEAAEQMARGVATLLEADVAVSVTGVAGDESIDGVPPGTVFIATLVDQVVVPAIHRFDGPAEQVCERATRQALTELIGALTGNAARTVP